MEEELIEQLEESQLQIQRALVRGDRRSREEAYMYAVSHVQGLATEVYAKWNELKNQGVFVIYKDVCQFTDLDLDLNLRFCAEVINERMRSNFSSPIAPYAVQMLFFTPEPLQRSMVLYEEKGHDGQERQLKVSDFISVLDYAMKFAEMNSDADFDKYNKAKLAIKTVDLAINHKPVDKPLNKTLHIVNDILTECAKSIGKDQESKRAAAGISLLVDLAIDFLVRG